MRLVPFVALMFFINYLDRTAIGFAAPNGMNEDLALSAAQFGFASGVFFIGYILLEVPSQPGAAQVRRAALARTHHGQLGHRRAAVHVGAELRAAGRACASCSASPRPASSPARSCSSASGCPRSTAAAILVLFYLAQPLTHRDRRPARRLAHPAGRRLSASRAGGFMFLGVADPARSSSASSRGSTSQDRPADAKWLTRDEQVWLTDALDRETYGHAEEASTPRLGALRLQERPRVGARRSSTSASSTASTRSPFFLPTIIEGFQAQTGQTFDVLQKGLITAIPYLPAAIVMYFWSRDASKRGRRPGTSPVPAHRRCRQHPARPVRRLARGHHRGHHRHGVRDLRRAAELLDAARPLPHRGGGGRGRRAHQHDRQPGGLLRAVRHGRRARLDRRVRGADVHRRLRHAGVGRAHGAARPQQPHQPRPRSTRPTTDDADRRRRRALRARADPKGERAMTRPVERARRLRRRDDRRLRRGQRALRRAASRAAWCATTTSPAGRGRRRDRRRVGPLPGLRRAWSVRGLAHGAAMGNLFSPRRRRSRCTRSRRRRRQRRRRVLHLRQLRRRRAQLRRGAGAAARARGHRVRDRSR